MDTKYLHTRLNILKVMSIIILTALLSFGLFSYTDNSPGGLQAEIVGQWRYDFPQEYDPEILFYDSPAVTSATISGKEYLILSFEPSRGPNNSRIFIFDTENPLSPRLTSTIAREQMGRDSFMVESAAVQDGILYCSLFHDEGLWMVDISDPTQPRDMGIAPIEITKNLIVTGDIAYASGQMYKGVSVSDISDPKSVGEVARIELPSRECYLAVSGHVLYIGIEQTLTIIDMSAPRSPKTLCTYELNVPESLTRELPFGGPGSEIEGNIWDNWANIIDLQAAGDYLYVTFGAGQLRVIDVSDPAAPQEVADVDLGGFAIALTLEDDVLYVTKSGKETNKIQLCILDVSQPNSPRLMDCVETETVFGFGGGTLACFWTRPQVIDNYVYVASVDYMDVIEIR